MTKIAEELGLSDQGLAKICAKHAIPRPPRGYWAKLEEGKAVTVTPLPTCPEGTSERIRIGGEGARQRRIRENAAHVESAAVELGAIAIPATMRGLHPVVAEWVEQHRAEREKKRADQRANRHDIWWHDRVPRDLSERDRYRFRVTSALLRGFEAQGGRVIEGRRGGKLTLEASGEKFEISVVEKMRQFRGKPSDEPGEWTAFPHLHNSGLAPTGFLRFTITTYFGEGMKKEWVESDKKMADLLLPSVVVGLLQVGPALVTRREEREEWHRRYEAEQRAKEEKARLERLEAERWEKLRARAAEWHEAQQLRAFLTALETSRDDLASEVDGLPLSEWLDWARQRITKFDPLA